MSELERTYAIEGYNTNTDRRWTEARGLTARDAYDLAEDLRMRFPADHYTIVVDRKDKTNA